MLTDDAGVFDLAASTQQSHLCRTRERSWCALRRGGSGPWHLLPPQRVEDLAPPSAAEAALAVGKQNASPLEAEGAASPSAPPRK